MRRCLWILLPLPLTLAACGTSEAPPADLPSPGEQILDGAQRAMGMWPTPTAFQLTADATVQGPGGEFRTLIHSSADGRVRMEQSPNGFMAGIGETAAWWVEEAADQVEDLGGRDSFLRGHELHMLALLPRSRVSGPHFLGVPEVEGAIVLAVSLSFPRGDSIIAYFQPVDTLPVGLRVTSTDPDVFVSWSEWTESGGISLFGEAEFRQGDEVFRYTYDEVRLGALPDSLFEPPVSPPGSRP